LKVNLFLHPLQRSPYSLSSPFDAEILSEVSPSFRAFPFNPPPIRVELHFSHRRKSGFLFPLPSRCFFSSHLIDPRTGLFSLSPSIFRRGGNEDSPSFSLVYLLPTFFLSAFQRSFLPFLYLSWREIRPFRFLFLYMTREIKRAALPPQPAS